MVYAANDNFINLNLIPCIEMLDWFPGLPRVWRELRAVTYIVKDRLAINPTPKIGRAHV